MYITHTPPPAPRSFDSYMYLKKYFLSKDKMIFTQPRLPVQEHNENQCCGTPVMKHLFFIFAKNSAHTKTSSRISR